MLPHSVSMKGMLQGFDEDRFLFETNEFAVACEASSKAAELAMLGLAEEANSIMILWGAHATVKCTHDVRLEFFWAESDKPRPAGVSTPLEHAGYSEENRLLELREQALLCKNRIPKWSFSEESFREISKIVEKETQGRSARVIDATYGMVAEKLSDAYTALLSIALHLGWQEEVAELMAKIAHRIHADMQCQRLGTIRSIWRPYLLSGWLRDTIGADLHALQEYARFVYDTIEHRLKNGPLHPHSLYEDWTIRQIVEEIDRNTVTGIQNQSKDSVMIIDASAFFDGAIPSTIRREPATSEQILDTESRIGRALPADMKEFYSVTNGFEIVKTEWNPVDFDRMPLPPFEEVHYEEEEWMCGYCFELVRDLSDVPWPQISGGGIAFYEHDGQGTMYTWILDHKCIAKAKERLWSFYETASDEGKRDVDQKITSQFGSREVLDGISEYCVFEIAWGGGDDRVYHTFRHYLESIAVRTRDSKERSPLKSEFFQSDDYPLEDDRASQS